MATTDFTIADVLEWARTKPAEQRFDYNDNTNCGMCQFLRETGRADHPSAGATTWTAWEGQPYSGVVLADGSFEYELNISLMVGNFGGLVEKLEKLCPETPVAKSDWARLDAYMADIELASA